MNNIKEKLLEIWESGRIERFLRDNKDIVIKAAIAMVLVVVAFFIFIGGSEDRDGDKNIETPIVVESRPEATVILVDVGGEVNSPMVVELEEGSRVNDAIAAAGGVTENADLTDLNRAGFVEDGDKIIVPAKLDESSNDDVYPVESVSDNKVNINTADIIQLQKITGVGPATAEKIISYRNENGRFKKIEDIMNVSGIGEKTFEKMKNEIRI